MGNSLRVAFAIALALTTASSGFAQSIDLVLSIKESTPITQLAQSVTDPRSPRFQKPYTSEEIRALAGPSEAEYQALLSRLSAQGFTVTRESPTHLWLSVKAEHETVERTFNTTLIFDEATKRHSSLGNYSLSRSLPLVVSVSGLDTTRKSQPRMKFKPANASTRTNEPTGIDPSVIADAYGFNPIYKAGFKGKGQHIAIATYDSFHMYNISGYFLRMALPMPKFDQVKFNGEPTGADYSDMETEADVELSGALAPEAEFHVFASASNSDPGEVQLFTAILDDGRAKIVNYSWGDCETHVSAQHADDMTKVFARAVAQGVNIMVASGDSGSAACGDGHTVAEWPAAHPDVVAVGGTSFWTSHGKIDEDAWEGSGGGVSKLFTRPSWQAGVDASYKGRAFPDVAFNSDPYTGQSVFISYPINAQPDFWTLGGTSIAAPQWAAYLALVNQARGSKGGIAFLPTYLYGLDPATQAKLFNDVTKGKNGAFSAGTAWDAVTGWGSMKGAALHDFLVSH